MKTIPNCLTAAGAALLISSATSHAQTPYQYQPAPYSYAPNNIAGHFYLNVDAGGTLMQSVSVENLQARLGFNAGTRADFNFGYNLTDFAAVEFETGVIWSSLNGSGPQIISPVADRADLFQVPLLGNFILKAPLKCGITPYIGGGAGGIISTLELSRNSFDDHISDNDFTFAYQGLAGVTYTLDWNMEVGIGYKFLGTLDHRWFGDDPNLYVHTSPTYSHSILATFTWRF